MARVAVAPAPAVNRYPRPHSSGGGGGYESADLKPGRWGVAKREAVLSWDPEVAMPEFRQVVADGGITWLDLSEAELLLGGKLENIFIVSHRWSVYTHMHTRETKLFASTRLLY